MILTQKHTHKQTLKDYKVYFPIITHSKLFSLLKHWVIGFEEGEDIGSGNSQIKKSHVRILNFLKKLITKD